MRNNNIVSMTHIYSNVEGQSSRVWSISRAQEQVTIRALYAGETCANDAGLFYTAILILCWWCSII